MSRRNSLEQKAVRRVERAAPKKPGSLKPFHRIQALVAAVVEAQNVEAQVAVVRAREALAGYKSRGHGWRKTT